MHEMAYIVDIIDTVCASAQKAGATKVKQITLNIGAMRDFHQEYIDAYFTHFSKDTLAEGAEVIVNFIPANVRCKCCGAVLPVDLTVKDDAPHCPDHPDSEVELVSGMELAVESIAISRK